MRWETFAASLSIVSLATTASAQAAEQVAVWGCQQAAVATIRVPMAESDSARFMPNWRVSRDADLATIVEGDGQFQHRVGASWHRFTYRCKFDYRTGAASNVIVKFPSNAAERRRHSDLDREAVQQTRPTPSPESRWDFPDL